MLKHQLLMGAAAAILATVSVAGAAHAAITLDGYNVSSAVAMNAIPAERPRRVA